MARVLERKTIDSLSRAFNKVKERMILEILFEQKHVQEEKSAVVTVQRVRRKALARAFYRFQLCTVAHRVQSTGRASVLARVLSQQAHKARAFFFRRF